ncbi:iron chaperone [Micromonospora sp. CPCC 206061]|uniref:iron chaperone n=1 Tax=Micromonospora sp. CPCC 206061 TaxID=3122410 RepID=UPI002FF0DD01
MSTKKSTKSTATATKTYDGFSDEERDAMKEHARELKTAARRGAGAKAAGEGDVLAKIAEMAETDRGLAERIHAIVKANAPDLAPRLWYGMPAYAKDGKVLCHFQPAQKFKTRYATFSFTDVANLDDGTMWPTTFALTTMTPSDEARISALVKQAVS